MSKVKCGDVCAYLGKTESGKGIYHRIGTAYKDEDYNGISIKIDSLPLAGANWQGWLNIFDTAANGSAGRPDEKGKDPKDPLASKQATKGNPF